ncbi:MAG: hypothetical protein Q8865_08515 [Bacillota bacterium]|nr:hypothetical protein [Bacillota bacterium]
MVSSSEKIICAISYLGFLFFLPLVALPGSAFGKRHANQALVIFLGGIITGFIRHTIFFGGLLSAACGLFLFVMFILGIVYAATGKDTPLPVIGDIILIK